MLKHTETDLFRKWRAFGFLLLGGAAILAGCGSNSGSTEGAPVSLIATSSTTGVALSWTASSTASGYAVLRCLLPAGATNNPCATSAVDACTQIGTSKTNTYLDVPTVGQAACYRVKACSSADGSQCGPVSTAVAGVRRVESPSAQIILADDERTAYSGDTVSLHAFASKATGTPIFAWSQFAGTKVTLLNANTANPSFVAPAVTGTAADLISFKVTISDANGPGAETKMAVNVQPQQNLIVKTTVKERKALAGDQVSLHAVGSGATTPVYEWTQVSPASPKATLANANRANPVMTAPDVDGVTYRFQVRYSDSASGRSVTEKVAVTVSKHADRVTGQPLDVGLSTTSGVPPQVLTLQPGIVAPVVSGTTVRPTVGVTGGSGTQTVSWTQIGGATTTVNGGTTVAPIVTAPVVTAPQTLTFQATVTDSTTGQKATATVHVPVAPVASTAVTPATIDTSRPVQIATVGQVLTLRTTLTNPIWEQIAGVASGLSATSGAQVSVTAPNIVSGAENILVRVSGRDAAGRMVRETYPITILRPPSVAAPATAPATVAVVAPTLNAPLALASVGVDRADEGRNGVVLGVQATGGGGSYTYSWVYDKQAGGPDITLRDATTSHPTLNVPGVNGKIILRFTVTVRDGGQTASTPVYLVVNDLASSLTAGTLNNLSVPSGHLVSLNPPVASGGVIPYAYAVTQTAGRSVGTLTGRNPVFPAPTMAAGAADEVLTFRYTVADAVGNTAQVLENVTVLAPPLPLTANLTGPASGDVQSSVSLSTNVNGGKAPYTYQYVVSTKLPVGTSTIPATANPTFKLPTLPDTNTVTIGVTLTVTDSSTPALTARAGPLTIDVRAVKAADAIPDVKGEASTCVVCGDKATGVGCNDMELVLADQTACPAGNNFCMSDVVVTNGVTKQYGYCGTNEMCYNRWWSASSDNAVCTSQNFSNTGDIRCTYCCRSANCADGVPSSKVYNYTAGRETAP